MKFNEALGLDKLAKFAETIPYSEVIQRSFPITNLPEKVFIEYDGPRDPESVEYSEYEPQGLKAALHDLLYGTYAHENFITLFYSIPEVFAPIHEIAKRVSDATWQLKRDWNDEVDFDHPEFNRLFSQPNPLMIHKDLVYQSVCYEILTGKVLWQFNNGTSPFPQFYKNVATWSNLPPHKVTAKLNPNADPYTALTIEDYISKWEMPWKSDTRSFTTDQVLPICHFDLQYPGDFNKSAPLIKGASMAIKNLVPVYQARGTIYIKRGALGFLVSKKSDESGMISLTKSEKEEAINDFQQTYGVTEGKAPVGVTSVPVEFIRTAMSIAELQPFDETLQDAVSIYSTLRVPRHLVPSKDQSKFANADTAMKEFYTDVIIPWAKRYAEAWTNKFKFDRRYIQPDYSHISFLQINRKEKSTVDKIDGSIWLERWTNSVCSLNEWIVAVGGVKGEGNIYEKKFFDLIPEEIEKVKTILNLTGADKNLDNGNKPKVKPEDPGA